MHWWCIVTGSLFDGAQEIVGPFHNEQDAEDYMESHNLGHFEKAVFEMTTPRKGTS